MKKIILIGRSTAGKTTLCQYLNNQVLKYSKTQSVEIINDTMIDTPGEYLERRQFRGALTIVSADVDIIVLVQDATENGTMFPPAYTSIFTKPSIGIVTKSDIAISQQIEDAKAYLKMAGADKVFVTSSFKGEGFEDIIYELES